MKAILLVVGLVAFFAAGVVGTLLITGWDPSDDDVATEPVAIAVTSTAPELDPLAPVCEVVWDYFEPWQVHQGECIAAIDDS